MYVLTTLPKQRAVLLAHSHSTADAVDTRGTQVLGVKVLHTRIWVALRGVKYRLLYHLIKNCSFCVYFSGGPIRCSFVVGLPCRKGVYRSPMCFGRTL